MHSAIARRPVESMKASSRRSSRSSLAPASQIPRTADTRPPAFARSSSPASAGRSVAGDGGAGVEREPMTRDTVRRLVSEVGTNAVLHSEAPPGANIKLAASLSDGSVTVTVADAGTGAGPSPRAPDPMNGGYG